MSSYRSAAHVVHHAELVAVGRLAGIEDGDDVGVLESGGQRDLTLKSPPGRRRGKPPLQEDLDGYLAPGGLLNGLVDDPLPTTMQLADNFVAFDGDARGESVQSRR